MNRCWEGNRRETGNSQFINLIGVCENQLSAGPGTLSRPPDAAAANTALRYRDLPPTASQQRMQRAFRRKSLAKFAWTVSCEVL